MRLVTNIAALSLLAATAAPSAASDPTPAPLPSWTGFYVGGSLNYGRGANEAAEVNGPRAYTTEFGAAYASGHMGWQRQWARIVGGVELEAGYLGMGSSVTRDVTGGSITSGTELGAYGALSGRMGMLITPSLLVYGRAGIALADINGKTTQTCDAGLCGGAQSTTVSEATTKSPSWGVLLGAGLEHQLSSRWSGRIEYKYMDFRKELALPAVDGPGWNHSTDVHSVSVGFSYRF
ncbi:MAG: outer membrane beta-barrel protein [Hyphomicrobiaceae bacterium]|nr:outer membrane beta-barrel protein [Hyphomicrobiaceae bacterium]